jgi:ectoine hydroxylase-related dioxygenase (phytanoyl-CoA dioxygenase family)
MDKEQMDSKGYTVMEGVYTPEEVNALGERITQADSSSPAFRKHNDLFAVRQFLKAVPSIRESVFNARLRALIADHFGADYFVVKSIYFDKPEHSNWFVAWHQDLTISVDKKINLDGFGPWTTKQDQFAVQPPLPFLENIFTVRIHLDDTDEHNGALRVIPGSHRKGIYRYSSYENANAEETCRVKKGGVMIMRPLLQHASNRTTNGTRRRVIHMECGNMALPAGLDWAEKMELKKVNAGPADPTADAANNSPDRPESAW